MITFPTRAALRERHQGIRTIVQTICHAMEIANRSDNEAKRDLKHSGEFGNMPQWADHQSVYGYLRNALRQVLFDYYDGWDLFEHEIPYGSGAAWDDDVWEVLASTLVVTGGTHCLIENSFPQRPGFSECEKFTGADPLANTPT